MLCAMKNTTIRHNWTLCRDTHGPSEDLTCLITSSKDSSLARRAVEHMPKALYPARVFGVDSYYLQRPVINDNTTVLHGASTRVYPAFRGRSHPFMQNDPTSGIRHTSS
jgi:hypothetical protein